MNRKLNWKGEAVKLNQSVGAIVLPSTPKNYFFAPPQLKIKTESINFGVSIVKVFVFC